MKVEHFPKEQLPTFNGRKMQQLEGEILNIIEKNKQSINDLLSAMPAYTWDNLMQPLEEMEDALGKTWSPLAHLHGVLETEEVRATYNNVLPKLTAYHTELSQNVALFNAIHTLAQSKEREQLTPAQQKIIDNDLRDFKLSGIHLPQDKKDRLLTLSNELSQLTTKFSENLLDATHAWHLHVTAEKELAGLTAQGKALAIENAKAKNLTGYILTLDFPSYSSAIKSLENRQLRKTLYNAYVSRASECGPTANTYDNTKIMLAILDKRHEVANLVGFKNYAEYSLATKMAKTPERVLKFLQELLIKSRPIAEVELQEIKAIAKRLDNITDLAAWDVSYYSEKLQAEKFQFTEEDLRPYFPIHTVLTGMFTIVQQLFGISINEEQGIDVWHQDVKFFSIYDEQHELRGGFYIDLYARQNKRSGAWMDDFCSRRLQENKEIQYPVAFLTCNFMPPVAGKPALLTHDEVLTLFHEFGHCLHHLLTKIDYKSVAGINGVAWDAVEFPSQFMENFCWEKISLDKIAKHYTTGEPIPNELYQKMLASKHYLTGLQMLRQLEFAIFDFRLHLEYKPHDLQQVDTVLKTVRQQTALLPVPEFNRFQHSFTHVFAGGYAAGYYSYKWAEVLSADAYELFSENGVINHEIGKRFLENILEVGGERDALDSFIAFRGREPKIDALLTQSGITAN